MALVTAFLRDDDVWQDDDVFFELDAFARANSLPVNYAVIPCRLEGRMAGVLREAKLSAPGLLDIVQHGYKHINYNSAGGAKYEFGPGRSYRQQYRDIEAGMKAMASSFGPLFTPAFVPPYHGFNATTLKVVEALGFSVFSAGKRAGVPLTGVADLPAEVSLNDYRADGRPAALDLPVMLGKARRAFREGGVIGFVYHHGVIRKTADMKAMKMFLRFLIRLRESGQLRTAGFSELAGIDPHCDT